MGRERREIRRDSRRRLDPRLRRLSYEERRRVYRRRRIVALLVLALVLLALVALLFGAFSLLGREDGSAENEVARGPEMSHNASRQAREPNSPGPAEDDAEQAPPPDVSEKPAASEPEQEAPEKTPAEDPVEPSREALGEPLDVLVLGVDRRPKGSFIEGSRADTLMLARVFPRTGEVRLLSIPRDLFVEVEAGVEDRINAAYTYGGARGAAEAVEGATGISVDHFAIVDFRGFKEVVNTVDGVTVEITDEMPPGRRMEGVQTLNGRQALFYARYRGTAGGDLDRIERQQQIVTALRGELLSWGTVPKLPGLVESVLANVETNLGFKESLSLARLLLNSTDARMTSSQLRGSPVTLPDGRQVLVPQPEENETLLREFRG